MTSTEPTTTAPEYQSYGEIVWGQFTKYKLSLYSVYGVVALFVLAIITPFIALNVPFYLYIPQGTGPQNLQGLSFPWFWALFDRNFFESGVDIFFNFLIFYSPLALLAWFIAKRGFSEDKAVFVRQRFHFLSLVALLALVGFALTYLFAPRQPYVNYVAMADMDGVKALFPILEYSYRDGNILSISQSPSMEHFLGTDRQGRDVFTRLLYGTRISLTIGVVAVSIYTFIGLILGSLAGYFGGRVDSLILRLIEIMMCFPVLFLILTLVGFIQEPSIFHIMLIIGFTGWTGIARLVRGEFLRLRNLDFVQAAVALGFTRVRIIFRHVLPNAVQPVFVAATFGVAGAILVEATLSFLGVGPVGAPSWGQILNDGRSTQQTSLILSSGFAIFITISLLNLIGEGLRDATDPKMRK